MRINNSKFRYLLPSLLFLLPPFSTAETETQWELSVDTLSIGENEIKWELLEDCESEFIFIGGRKWEHLKGCKGDTFSDIDISPDTYQPPKSIEEVKDLIDSLEPEDSDFLNPLRIGISFPTNHQLSRSESSHSIYSLSTFKSGGSAGGSGNQNYAYMFDFGLTDNTDLSGFYSVADDPLYESFDGNKTIPNYWEAYGISLKRRFINNDKWSISTLASLESWVIRNGDDINGNVFDSRGSELASRNIIGSLSIPITRKINEKLDLNLLAGGTFLPYRLGDISNKDNYYGNNFYLGSGLSFKHKKGLNSFASFIQPLGPGENAFNSSKYFYRTPIYNLGINYDLNPIIGIEGRITNGFGATPSTSLLTIPSSNQLLYFAGISYKPFAIDSPQKRLSSRHRQLAFNGLTVGSALIPPRGKSVLSFNPDSKGNLFGSISTSLSNCFQLDIFNFGSFNNRNTFAPNNNSFVNTYLNDYNYNTRYGGKFVLMSPLREGFTWLSSRVSVGRNQQNKQGYLFHEWINTFEINDKLAFNLNPKLALSGLGSLYSLGISSNIHLSDSYQLIPEVNISLSELSETNSTFAIRRVFGQYLYADLYASSAAGLQDLGQLISSSELRKGLRLTLLY